jgi:hypothetical protein
MRRGMREISHPRVHATRAALEMLRAHLSIQTSIAFVRDGTKGVSEEEEEEEADGQAFLVLLRETAPLYRLVRKCLTEA